MCFPLLNTHFNLLHCITVHCRIQTGKTFTLNEFLPAVLRTYGMPEWEEGMAEGAAAEPEFVPRGGYAEGTPDW
jgi:hypothetical protein